MIDETLADWPIAVDVVHDHEEKREAFQMADAALAASGTVCLELAMAGVPMIATYKLDPIATRLRFLVKAWSANLPNLILDYPAFPEYYDEFVRPALLARQLERLLSDTPERKAQVEACRQVQHRMTLDQQKTSADKAAEVVLSYL